jgi:aminoglycoside phosphotransferase
MIGLGSPWPSRLYAQLAVQALRHGLPARRGGPLLAVGARLGFPRGVMAAVGRRFPARRHPELEELLGEITSAWPRLDGQSIRLPDEPPFLSALALQRAAGLTVFILGDDERPLLVAKRPGDQRLLEAERAALRRAEPTEIAPRYLGEIGDWYAQEGLPGKALGIPRLRELSWDGRLSQLAASLAALSGASVRAQPPDGLATPVEAALTSLSGSPRRALEAAWGDVQRLDVSVLQHGDTSAQNCLFEHDRFSGLVDWERADERGVPGFDTWNAALALLEHSVGLGRWSQKRVLAAFRDNWLGAWGTSARAAAADSATAAGVPESLLGPLEVVFFARRLGRRLARPDSYATTPATAARMLELACAL